MAEESFKPRPPLSRKRRSGSDARHSTALREIIPNDGESYIIHAENICSTVISGVNLKQRKRVRFADADPIDTLSGNLGTSLGPTLGTETFYVPKTSEYSSYKKLMEEVGSNLHSLEVHNEVFQSRNHEMKSLMKDGDDLKNVSYRNETSKFLLPVKELTPRDNTSSFLPTGMVKTPGMQYRGLFAEKRHDILKFVSKNMCLELEEFVTKGSDLIPYFLLRLGIKRKSKNDNEIQKSTQEDRVPDSTFSKRCNRFSQSLMGDNASLIPIQQGSKESLEHHLHEDLNPNHLWQLNLEGQVSPAWHVDEKDTQYNNKRASSMDIKSMELDIGTALSSRCLDEEHRSMDTLIPDFEYFSPTDVPCRRQQLMKLSDFLSEAFPQDSSAKQLVPFGNSSLVEFNELDNPDEYAVFTRSNQCAPWLGRVDTDTISEEESSFNSDGTLRNIMNHVPHTLCSAPFVSVDFQLIGNHADSNMLNYFPSNGFYLSLDKINQSLDGALVPSSNFMLESGSIMIDSSMEHSLFLRSDLQIQEASAAGTFGIDDNDGIQRFKYGECGIANFLQDYF